MITMFRLDSAGVEKKREVLNTDRKEDAEEICIFYPVLVIWKNPIPTLNPNLIIENKSIPITV